MNRLFGTVLGAMTLTLLLTLLTPGCAPESDMGRDTANIKNVGTAEFEAEVLKASSPVVVDFYATWCGPCKRLAPIMEDLAESYKSKVKFVKVDIDNASELANQYQIEGVPTVIFYQGGKVASKVVGLVPREVLKGKIEALSSAKPTT